MLFQDDRFVSQESDWTDAHGNTVVIWPGTLITKKEYPEFVDWIKEETGATAAPIGSFSDDDGLTYFVFTVGQEGLDTFTLWRFNTGMRWFYDAFWEMNTPPSISSEGELSRFYEILEALGISCEHK